MEYESRGVKISDINIYYLGDSTQFDVYYYGGISCNWQGNKNKSKAKTRPVNTD